MNNKKIIKYGQVMEMDHEKCIGCGNCVRTCQSQNVACLELKDEQGKKKSHKIEDKPCISCGQCSLVCPVKAIEAENDLKKVEEALSDKTKRTLFQFAPSVRVSLASEFGGDNVVSLAPKIITALHQLGADFVVDDTTSADFTTTLEAKGLANRIKENKNLPMISSCCPAWVNFVEYSHPEIIPNLTTIRAPHIILGGLFKHYLAKEKGVDIKDIVVISIMPCTAKKTDVKRAELEKDGIKPVDISITVREFVTLLKKYHLDPMKLEDSKPDALYANESGSGAIYGSSGGVTESVLRSLYFFATGKDLENVEFSAIRGIKGVKEAKVIVEGSEIKAAAVSGLSHINEVLSDLSRYQYVEIMACPGGCLGGGGQPFSENEEIKQKRSDELYEIDAKSEIRLAHQNPLVSKILFEDKVFKADSEIFVTSYKNKSR